jgi:predicted short-subunit dehydrogenase-like oxidoreductase (DUF2520 family)
MPVLRVIGPGRAGGSLSAALAAAGWQVAEPVRRGQDPAEAADGVDLLVIATPDAAVAGVAAAVTPVEGVVVAHLSGSLLLDALAPHDRRASLHPLRSIPTPTTPLAGAWYPIAGDRLAGEVVAAVGGRSVVVDDDHRVIYHAAACIASNHLVALLGQVQRVAAAAGVPFEAYLELAGETLDNVGRLGPAPALTGPVSRGDWAVVGRHLAALPPDERLAYEAMAAAASKLVGMATTTAPEAG